MVLLAREWAAPFPFLAWAQWDTEAHQRALSSSRDSPADGTLRALPVRHALTVGAVGDPDAWIYNAAQRRLAIRILRAVPVIGLQVRAFFHIEHGT